MTVFGESSGAGLVNALLTSPLAAGLFHRAILQSGSVLGPMQHLRSTWYLLPSGESIGTRVQAALGVEGEPGSEIPYVFGTLVARDLPGLGRLDADAGDRALSEAMMRYWVGFAEHGVPSAEGLPPWPRFVDTARPALELGTEVRAVEAPHAEACDVFDAAWAEWRTRRP